MDNIETCLINIAEQEDIVDPVINNLPKTEGAQGYLSNIKVVSLQGQTRSGQNCKLSLILKIAATNEEFRQDNAVPEIYQNEIRMYKNIFPAFYEFEKQKGIANPFAMVPKCYRTFGKAKPEILIFEDLSQTGYQSWNNKLQMDSEHVQVVLKEYGKFHALSFAIRDQNPELFQQLTENLENHLISFLKRSGFFKIFVSRAKRLLTLLDSHADSKIFKKYEEFLDGVEEKFEFLISDCDSFYAILHGDCWCNNMLFKFTDSERLQLSDIRLIDFQMTRMGSPVFDIVYFFYVSSSAEVLKDLRFHKHVYYDSFTHHLKALGSDAERLYPFSVYEEHWKKYATFGLILCSLVCHTMLSEENELSNLAEVVEEGGSIEKAFCYETVNIDAYKNRMRTLIEHFVDNGFI